MKKLNKLQKIATYDFFVGQAMLIVLPRVLNEASEMITQNSAKKPKKKNIDEDAKTFNLMKYLAIDSCFELAEQMMVMRKIKRSTQKAIKLAKDSE